MEIYEWEKDVKILCQTAKGFPEGIREAFESLQQNVPHCENRTWYGVSSMDENGAIIYKAAVNEITVDESGKYGLESFTITQGTYLAKTVSNWMKDPGQIGATFKKLLADPRFDNSFPCVEWYNSADDVLCLVRIVE